MFIRSLAVALVLFVASVASAAKAVATSTLDAKTGARIETKTWELKGGTKVTHTTSYDTAGKKTGWDRTVESKRGARVYRGEFFGAAYYGREDRRGDVVYHKALYGKGADTVKYFNVEKDGRTIYTRTKSAAGSTVEITR